MGIWARLQLHMDKHRVIALVGGGGKSSTLYALAREARDAGRSVIVTTTTHIMAHPGLFLTDDAAPAALSRHLAAHGILTLGRFLKEGKLTGVGDVAACSTVADITLVEADGARTLPLKAPANHEPVIPPCANAVLALAGMDCVGLPIGETCHRPAQVCALLDRPADHLVTPQDVAAVLTSAIGGRKGVAPPMDYRCILNKADSPQRLQYAQDIISLLRQNGIVAIDSHYSMEERGGKCLF